jgi:DNA-binding GntR family transcriptional regulator
MKKILMIAANPRAKSLARPVQVRALVRLKEVFHTTVLEAAGNSLLQEMAERAQRIPLASLRTKPVWSDAIVESVDPRVSHYQHRAIHDAILRRDGDAAENAMRGHIGSALDLLTEQYHRTAAAPSAIERAERATRMRQ